MKTVLLAAIGVLAMCVSVNAQETVGSAQYHAIHNPNSPNYADGDQQQVAPQVRWADRWGALAEDGKGTLGVAVDAATKADASNTAIADCRKRGGGGCQVSLAYFNQCAVLVAGNTGSNVARAETKDAAISLAMKGCEGRDGVGACRVYYSGCSLPVQIQ